MNRLAQSAIEFTVITSISLLLFSVAFIVAQQNVVSAQYDLYDVQIEQMLDKVHREIELANSSGTGYSRGFDLPSTFGERDYCLEIRDYASATDELILETGFDNDEYFRFLAGIDVDLSPASSVSFHTGKVTLTNSGGRVLVDTSLSSSC